MTRQLKKFFDGFHVRPTVVKISREKRTEFASSIAAPARIIVRRKTVACDENAKLEDILDPSLQPIEPEQTTQPARIIARRNTHRGCVSYERNQYGVSGSSSDSPPMSEIDIQEDFSHEAAGTSTTTV